MKVVIAPDSFKEALSADEAARAIARGVRAVRPDAEIDLIPMADGGEGTVRALVEATGGQYYRSEVTGPLGKTVEAEWGMLGGGTRTAIVEMAAASGLALVPEQLRDPERTTTFGTGQLVHAALDAGARKVIIGIGGSATSDGGTGAAQAWGIRFLDTSDTPLPPGLTGGDLHRIARIDMALRDPRIEEAALHVACDVDNPLTGPNGAACIYAPQKGATPEQVARLDAGLVHLAEIIERDLHLNVRDFPGAGAAGGLGAGLVAFAGAELAPGIELVMEASRFAERVAGADLILTGEGRLDRQSTMGKTIAGIARCAARLHVPVIALAGRLGEGVEACDRILDGYHAITPDDMPLSEALARTAELLEATTRAILEPE